MLTNQILIERFGAEEFTNIEATAATMDLAVLDALQLALTIVGLPANYDTTLIPSLPGLVADLARAALYNEAVPTEIAERRDRAIDLLKFLREQRDKLIAQDQADEVPNGACANRQFFVSSEEQQMSRRALAGLF